MKAARVLFPIMTLAVFIGCASGYVIKEPIDINAYTADDTNVIVKNQSKLVVPDGWQFTRSKDKPTRTESVESSVFFMFDDRHKNIYGRFEYTLLKNLDGAINGEALAKLHAESILTHITDKVIHRTSINRKEAFIVTGRHKKKNWDFMTVLIPEGNAFNEVQLLSDPGYLKANPQVAYRVFNSYRFAPKNLNERSIKGGIKFKSADGYWLWQEDWMSDDIEGYLITDATEHETPIDYIGIARTEHGSMQVIQTMIANYNEVVTVPQFDVNIGIGNRRFAAKAIVSKNRKDLVSVYYLFPANNKYHIVMVCFKEGATAGKAERIHLEWGLLTDTLNKYLSW